MASSLQMSAQRIDEILLSDSALSQKLFDQYRILNEQNLKDAFVMALIGRLILEVKRPAI